MVRLFDIIGGKVVPSEHCYSLESLKCVIDEFGEEDAPKIFAYIFYMTCPNPDLNPFFDMPETEKEEFILKEVDADFSTDADSIIRAIKFCEKAYQTPTYRAYMGIKSMLDRLAKYMESTDIEHGRDGNITALINAASKFDAIRQSFKGTLKDLEEEQQSQVRGQQKLAYDQD